MPSLYPPQLLYPCSISAPLQLLQAWPLQHAYYSSCLPTYSLCSCPHACPAPQTFCPPNLWMVACSFYYLFLPPFYPRLTYLFLLLSCFKHAFCLLPSSWTVLLLQAGWDWGSPPSRADNLALFYETAGITCPLLKNLLPSLLFPTTGQCAENGLLQDILCAYAYTYISSLSLPAWQALSREFFFFSHTYYSPTKKHA